MSDDTTTPGEAAADTTEAPATGTRRRRAIGGRGNKGPSMKALVHAASAQSSFVDVAGHETGGAETASGAEAPEKGADSAADSPTAGSEGKVTGGDVSTPEKAAEPVSEKAGEGSAPPTPAAEAGATGDEPAAAPEPTPATSPDATAQQLAATLQSLDPATLQALLQQAQGDGPAPPADPKPEEADAAEEPPAKPAQDKPAPGARVRVNALPDLARFDTNTGLDELTRRDLIENLRRAGQAARKSYEVTMARHTAWEERVRRARAAGLPESDIEAVEAEVRWTAPEPEDEAASVDGGADAGVEVPATASA